MIGKIKVKTTKILGKTYQYFELGDARSGARSIRIWAENGIFKKIIKFPIQNVFLYKNSAGKYILKEGKGIFIAFVVPCGYYGISKITNIEPNDCFVSYFDSYRFSRSALGISEGCILYSTNPDEKFVVTWSRTGKLFGKPISGYVVSDSYSTQLISLDDLPPKELFYE